MSGAPTLFAWVRPVQLLQWDHTWVTTYDNRSTKYPSIADVVSKGENLWFCWGDFHSAGGTPAHPDGAIGSQTSNYSVAKCVCDPNVASNVHNNARGTIFYYGIDGVCHQLANQVLSASELPGTPALTVALARGYGASSFFFGSYGVNSTAWMQKLAGCRSPGRSGESGTNLMASVPLPNFSGDEFERTARSVLRDDNETLDRLLELRQQAVAEVMRFRARQLAARSALPSAEEMNQTYNSFFDRAAKLLGYDSFSRIFGVSPATPVNIVDPEQFSKSAPR